MNQKTPAEHVKAPHSGAGAAEANREEMIVSNIPLVQMIAKHLALRLPPSVTLDELISAGSSA